MIVDSTLSPTSVNLAHCVRLTVQPCRVDSEHAGDTAGRWSVVAVMVTGDRTELSCWDTKEMAIAVYVELVRKWRKWHGKKKA